MSGIDAIGPRVVAALDTGDVDGALALIDDAIAKAAPGDRFPLQIMHGRLQLAVGDPASALADFSSALASADGPEQQAEALLARAEVAEQLGRIDAARADLAAARNLIEHPKFRAVIEQTLGRIERDSGDLSLAIDLLSNAHAVLSGGDDIEQRVDVTLDLAMALRLVGAVRQAIDLLRDLPDTLMPDTRARVMLQIGTTHGFAGESAQAMAAYDEALVLFTHPLERAAARYNRAVVLRELGRLDDAAVDLEQSLAENNGVDLQITFDGLLLSGILARERGDLHASLDALRRAADVDTTTERHGRVRLELGTTLAATGLYGLASDELTAALTLVTDDTERARALRLRGLSRREMSQHSAALADIESSLVLIGDPDEYARATLAAAALLASLGERRAALDRAGALVFDDLDEPSRLILYVQRGSLRSELGDLDGATADLEQAAELAERLGDRDLQTSVLADLGAIYLATGQSASAQATLRVAATLGVSGEAAFLSLMNLGNQLLADGAMFAALDAWEQAAAAAEDDRNARARAFITRANALLRYAEYVPAQMDFTRALTLNPNQQLTDQATIGLRNVDGELEAFTRYHEQLTQEIAAMDAPSYRANPTYQRALLALTIGRYDEALIDATRATTLYRLHPEQAKAFALVALIQTAEGNCADALAALAEADERDPERLWRADLAEDWRWQRCPAVAEEIGVHDRS